MMVREKRFKYILEKLSDESEVGFAALSLDLNVSEDTIRRDIDTLASNGLLLKIRGGAIPRSHNPLTFKERIGRFRDDKEIIALKAQTLIKSGQTIFMDGGTSVYTLVSLLSTDIKLTVITNNLAIIPALSAYSGVELIVLGGKYLKDCTLYVTLEPCQMCAGALYWSQISKIVFGARDEQRGFMVMGTKLHPKTTVVSGIMANEAADLMKRFFIERRK